MNWSWMSYGVNGWWKSCGATVVAMLVAVVAEGQIHSPEFDPDSGRLSLKYQKQTGGTPKKISIDNG